TTGSTPLSASGGMRHDHRPRRLGRVRATVPQRTTAARPHRRPRVPARHRRAPRQRRTTTRLRPAHPRTPTDARTTQRPRHLGTHRPARSHRMSTTTTDGLRPGIDETEYHADPALSQSGAKLLLESPARYRWQRDAGEQRRDVFDFGHAAHGKVLGEGRELVIIDADDWRSK